MPRQTLRPEVLSATQHETLDVLDMFFVLGYHFTSLELTARCKLQWKHHVSCQAKLERNSLEFQRLEERNTIEFRKEEERNHQNKPTSKD